MPSSKPSSLLEKARISEAERSLAGRRLRLKGALSAVCLTALVAGGVYAYLGTRGDTSAPKTGSSWFSSAKAHCNPVEVAMYMKRSPAPGDMQGQTYATACYALAGKFDEARASLDSLDASQRVQAASVVFNIVHPIADAGDDLAAGPVMEFVLEYVPDNFMALYHAGMSAHASGNAAAARRHLEKFLQLYSPEDGWRRNATEVLKLLGDEATEE